MTIKVDDISEGTIVKKQAQVVRQQPRQESLWRQIKRNRLAYLLISPTIVAMLLVHFLPTLQAIYMSFLKINQFTLTKFLGAPFIGLDNYATIFSSTNNPISAGIQYAARNTILYAIAVNIGTISLGMVTALMINREFKGRGILRSFLLTPWIMPTFVVGLVWGFMWRSDTGVINTILSDWLHLTGDNRIVWLIGPNVFWAIVIPTIWRGFPFTMVLLLSGLQTIPGELYEAAVIDGANAWRRYYYITLPLLKPILTVVVLWGVIGSVYAYNIVITMFGNGSGYPGEWGDLLQPAIQRQSFNYFLFGLGSAVSTLMLIAMMAFVWTFFKVFRSSLTIQ